ncbi:MAG TPA: hypothetical protein VMD02_07160 [Candidatus Omnitrophota bacterium]|nr:hypothetical protein [Candidatus Omnitrophota bacterium]
MTKLNLDFDKYEKKGLYLIFNDLSHLELTEDRIDELTEKYWNDPAKIPASVKEAFGFKRCPFCPSQKEGGICDALHPILPFLEIVDRYVSYDPVVAVYKGHRKGLLRVADSKMQDALVYLSTLSLIDFCRSAARYRKYYYGVTPLMSAKETSARIYLNIFWEKKGDKAQIDAFLAEFKQLLKVTAENQIKRLSLICKNDVFVNAIAKAQIVTEFLSLDYDKLLEESFRNIENENKLKYTCEEDQ